MLHVFSIIKKRCLPLFFFAVISYDANVERVFSLMQSQWTKDRIKMTLETVKGILTLQYNFKGMSCGEFFVFLKSNKRLLTL